MNFQNEQDNAVGELIRQRVLQKGFGNYKQAGEAFFADSKDAIGSSEVSCLQYVSSLARGEFYFGTATSPHSTKPILTYRLSRFLQWLEIPVDDPIIGGLKNLYPDFIYPSPVPPYVRVKSSMRSRPNLYAASSLEERVRLLRPSHKKAVESLVDAFFETYKAKDIKFI